MSEWAALADALGDIRIEDARRADWWTNDEDHALLIYVLRGECVPWAKGLLASDWLADYVAAQQADLIAAITALRDRARDPKHGGLATVHEITALLPEEHR